MNLGTKWRLDSLRVDPIKETGEGDGFADVLEAANPGYCPFNPHPKTGVRASPEPAQVQVPLVGFAGQVVFLKATLQQGQVVDALASPDDLAVAFGGHEIDSQDEGGAGPLGLHIKSLYLSREMSDADGVGRDLGYERFLGRPKVVTVGHGRTPLLKGGDDLVIGQAGERLPDGFQGFGVPPEVLEVPPAPGQPPFQDEKDEVGSQLDRVLELGKGDFRLNHPEFDQVAAGLGPFRPECRPKTVDFAEGGGRGLVIELAALTQVSLLIEVLGFKKGRRPFAGARRQDGSIHEPEAAAIKKIADGLDDLGPDLEDGVLLARAQPEMAVLQQEWSAVLLGSDGIILGDLERFQVFDLE